MKTIRTPTQAELYVFIQDHTFVTIHDSVGVETGTYQEFLETFEDKDAHDPEEDTCPKCGCEYVDFEASVNEYVCQSCGWHTEKQPPWKDIT